MAKDYFVYLPRTGAAQGWGLEVTAAGYTRIAPGQRYPPARHPADHHFTFARGRVLHAHQLIFISAGSGVFESQTRQRAPVRVAAGQVMLLWPEVWHRYAPDPARGWVEHWVECQGPLLDHLLRTRLLRAEQPVVTAPEPAHLLGCFEMIHHWAGHDAGAHRLELATLAAHLYALVRSGGAGGALDPEQPLQRAVRQAQLRIAQRVQEPLNTQALAEELGVAYPAFRRAFRARVGLAPKQYHVQMRLRQVQALLTNTDLTVTAIARTLGYDSPYHLSQQFKRHTGIAPHGWRQRGRKLGRPSA